MDDNTKIKKNIYSISRGSEQTQKNIPKRFVCLSVTITYIYSTYSQVHILLIVARCAEQNQIGIILNTKGYRTH